MSFGMVLAPPLAELLHLAGRCLAELLGLLGDGRGDLLGGCLGHLLRGVLGVRRRGDQLPGAFAEVTDGLSGSLSDVPDGLPGALSDVSDSLPGALTDVAAPLSCAGAANPHGLAGAPADVIARVARPLADLRKCLLGPLAALRDRVAGLADQVAGTRPD